MKDQEYTLFQNNREDLHNKKPLYRYLNYRHNSSKKGDYELMKTDFYHEMQKKLFNKETVYIYMTDFNPNIALIDLINTRREIGTQGKIVICSYNPQTKKYFQSIMI